MIKIKIYLLASILLLIPIAFAGVIRKELKASFRVIFDKNQINSLQIGNTGLEIVHNEDNTLVLTSYLGNIEVKATNRSFVIESVPPPNDESFAIETEPEIKNVSDKDKYEIVEDKTEVSTEKLDKFDCMNTPLKDLIIHCDGNVRLIDLKENPEAQEQKEKFTQDLERRMREMKERFEQASRLFEENFKNMRTSIF